MSAFDGGGSIIADRIRGLSIRRELTCVGVEIDSGRGKPNMATTPQQRLQPDGQRSGRQLWAFGFFWLAVPLMILAGWLAGSRVGRLLRWSKADAEVRRTDVYLANPGANLQRNRAWGAAVTVRYLANGQVVETTVVRGFQSGVRRWMEQWTRQYCCGVGGGCVSRRRTRSWAGKFCGWGRILVGVHLAAVSSSLDRCPDVAADADPACGTFPDSDI